MSDTVKRWLGGGPTYTLDVVAASDYDAALARAEKAEAIIVDLGNRCLLAEAERDRHQARVVRLRVWANKYWDDLPLIIRDAWNFALADPVEEEPCPTCGHKAQP
jgi:hypothetical protein